MIRSKGGAAFLLLLLSITISAPDVLSENEPIVHGGGGDPIVVDLAARERNIAATPPGYKLFVEGLYVRNVVAAAPEKAGYAVEVWGLLIGPGVQTSLVTLPGAAVLLVRSGQVLLLAGDRKMELGLGASALVPEGTGARFINRDSARPVVLRAVIVSGRR
jgi:hypothetical protein